MQAKDPATIPWYRQFWPWFIIAIPSAAVIGGMVTLWLALSHPETLVVDETEYQQIRDELRAQEHSGHDTEGADG
jgi:hypothetical protein